MPCRFQLVVRDALEDIAKVDDHLVVNGLDTLVFSIDEYLQARISKCRQQCNKSTVCMLRCCQLKRLLVELAAVDNTCSARKQVYGA